MGVSIKSFRICVLITIIDYNGNPEELLLD